MTFLQNLQADAGRLGPWSVLLQGYKFILKHQKGSENVVADSLSRRPYSSEKEVDDTSDIFSVTDEQATIEQTDNHVLATWNTLEAPDKDNNDKLATIGHTDDILIVIILVIPEVPDEDDNVTQIEDKLSNATDEAKTEGTRHLDLLSTFSDIAQSQ